MRQWTTPPKWSALFKKAREIPAANLGYIGWFAANFVRGLFSGRQGGQVWGPRFPGIDALAATAPLAEVCARQWLESVTRAREALAQLPDASERVFTINYEELVSSETSLEQLVTDLRLADAPLILASFRRKLSPSEPKLWQALPQDDLAIFNRVMGPALIDLGYEK
jgi:hypothetical protein